MAEHKYIPSGIPIRCDKGTIIAPLIVVNPTSTIEGRQWATSGDKITGLSFQTFGLCACQGGKPCKPDVAESKWLKTAGSDIICIGNELLIDESQLPCKHGGIIQFDLVPPPPDPPEPPLGALSDLKNKMSGIVDKIMAPINNLKGALNGAIGGMIGSALGDAVSDMTADAIGEAVGSKIASDIQAKAMNKLMSKKGNAKQKLANVKGDYPSSKVNPDEFIAVNVNEQVSSLDFMIKTHK